MSTENCEVLIIGAGASGLLAGIKLREAGIENFVIVERSPAAGGTWLENTYPGAGCDIPAHLYSYSFAPNPGWSRTFALQPELLGYFQGQAERFKLTPKFRLGVEVTKAAFDAASGLWSIEASNGSSWLTRTLIVATGQLNKPYVPAIAGRETFAGPQFHSARWDHGVSLVGKRVGVVGCGASAVQFTPKIAPDVANLTIYQRSPPWISARGDAEYDRALQKLFRIPFIRLAVRWSYFLRLETIFWPAIKNPRGRMARQLSRWLAENLQAQVADPKLRAKLTPDYPIGCKRVLLSDDYYPTLQRPNVCVETTAISEIEPGGIRLSDGTLNNIDVLIWATGFAAQQFIAPLEIVGIEGRRLAEEWRSGPQAYRGVAVAGYPNMFILYGPNSNFGHNSVIFMVERQMNYVMQALRRRQARNLAFLDVKSDVQGRFNEKLRRDLSRTAYALNCNSWFKAKDGMITNNWSGSASAYAAWMEHFDLESYHQVAMTDVHKRA